MNKRCVLNSSLVLFLAVLSILLIVLGCEQDNPDAQSTRPNPLTNSIGMKLVYIPPGEFMMGNRDTVEEVVRKGGDENTDFTDEFPQHRVMITKGFFMGSTKVTQAQYRAIMGTNPSYHKGEDNPVEEVSWNDAVEFCKRLSEKEDKTYCNASVGIGHFLNLN